MIRLENVTHGFPATGSVLCDIDLKLDAGERGVLLGCNGCGKTTLLRILDGLVVPDAGTYTYDGMEVNARTLRERTFAARFRREVAHLFQNPAAMLFHPTVYDEIAFGPRQLGWADADARVRRWARTLGVDARLRDSPLGLSAGEKQKVGIAALLVVEPRVLLLDEPTAHLDPRSTGWLVDFLQDLNLTTLVTTHNLSLAPELGERLVVLGEDHRIVFDGAAEDLWGNPEILRRANLVHAHRHRHGDVEHRHDHLHDWD